MAVQLLSALGKTFVMADISNIRQLVAVARSRVLLICPECGQEHTEFADRLRGSRLLACSGDGCGYQFDLMNNPRRTPWQAAAGVWRKLYAALTPAD